MGWAEGGLGQGKELQVLVPAGTPGNGEDWEEYTSAVGDSHGRQEFWATGQRL